MREHGQLEQHLLHDEREAERGHGEIEAAQAQARQPQQVADDGREDGRRQQAEQRRTTATDSARTAAV